MTTSNPFGRTNSTAENKRLELLNVPRKNLWEYQGKEEEGGEKGGGETRGRGKKRKVKGRERREKKRILGRIEGFPQSAPPHRLFPAWLAVITRWHSTPWSPRTRDIRSNHPALTFGRSKKNATRPAQRANRRGYYYDQPRISGRIRGYFRRKGTK